MTTPHEPNLHVSASTPRAAARLRRAIDVAMVVVFFAIVSVPLVRVAQDNVDATIEKTELRRAATFPKVEWRAMGPLMRPKVDSLRNFPRQFDLWFNDHVGYRRQFIRVYNLAKVLRLVPETFGRPVVGPVPQSPVIVGREGWVFYAAEQLVDDFRCTHPFTQAELQRWHDVLVARRDWCRRRGIQYVVMIPPNQQTAYAQYMPRALTRVGRESRLDQLVATMNEPDGVPLLDVRQPLAEAGRRWPTYHKTDTHWNDYGAFIGYQQLCATLGRWFPELLPRSLDDFRVEAHDAEGGDLARMIDSPIPFREWLVTLEPKTPRQTNLKSADSLSDGTTGHLAECPIGELRGAVILHDSFLGALGPFVNEHFQRVRYAWTGNFPEELIESERPVVVIQEMVERKLMVADPRNSAAVDADGKRHELAREPARLR